MAHEARLGWLLAFAFACVAPNFLSVSMRDVALYMLLYIVVAQSFRMITLTGDWSLGHVVTMGVGAYASALLVKKLGFSVWIAMPSAALVGALIAYILSFPLFRLKGNYFLIGSFAAGEAIRLTWFKYRDPFGGPTGILRIPAPELTVPGLGTLDFSDWSLFYYLALGFTVLCLWLMWRLERSRIGLTLNAIHWRDLLAESVGVDVRRYKTLAFVIASFFAAFAGAMFSHYLGSANPNQFGLAVMLYVLVWVIVGGTRTFAGPVIGTVLLTALSEILRVVGVDEYRPAIYGIILILTILFLPQGLESLPGRVRDWCARRKGVVPAA
ncbi:MAG: branched-chain amino acid ABC transporter permease [Alphaproteobacteria bacterium]|nr:branched-chain amino acid ABC transporter permease [Alphaproteobacteria bacterium]